MLLFASL